MRTLWAGAAEVDITPILGTPMAGGFELRHVQDVHDPLYARAVVIDDGHTRLALVCLDVIDVMGCDVEAIRALVSDRQTGGLASQHVLVAATHTHSGPAVRIGHGLDRDESYCSWIVQRAAHAIQLAVRSLRPAELCWGMGTVHGVSFCRRYRMRDGTVRMNPGRGNPDVVEPTAAIDPDVPVLYVRGADGQPIASFTSFALHYVGTDDSTSVSADYFGHFARWMKRFFGPAFVPVLFNGASGQINNIDLSEVHPDAGHARAHRVAGVLAGEVLKVIHQALPQPEAKLGGVSATVAVPRKEITPTDVAVAQAILRGEAEHLSKGPFSWVVGQPIPPSMHKIYAAECVRMAAMPPLAQSEVQALRIGETAWVGLPGDAFVELGRSIKATSPAAITGITSHTNDNLGYIPTDKALLEEGGYETWGGPTFFVGPGAEPAIVQAAKGLLKRLFSGG